MDEAATDEAVAGGAAGPATTTGATVAGSPPKGPVRARVMRPGATKQARAEASTMTTRAKKETIDTRESKGIARIKSKGESTSYAECVYKALTRGELMLLAAQRER